MPAAVDRSLPLTVQLVAFDLDGTLVDTAADIAAAVNGMRQGLGMPAQDPAAIAQWIGDGAERLVHRALTGRLDGVAPAELFNRAFPSFLTHYGRGLSDRSRPFPGAQAVLAALRGQGLKLCCVTNKPEAFTLPLLQRLDLAHYFDLIISGDSLPQRKPDPLPLLHALSRLRVPPERAVLVGDSANDLLAGRAAGFAVICVSYGYNRGMDVRGLHPDAVIDTLAELPACLHPYAELHRTAP